MLLKYTKFIRFCLVGGANAIVYAAATFTYIAHFGFGENLASLLGFLTAVPFAFIAHRFFTFASRGLAGVELLRFVATQIASLLTSVLAMTVVVDLLGLHYGFGVLAGILVVPIITFFVLNKWVFRNQTHALGRGHKARQ